MTVVLWQVINTGNQTKFSMQTSGETFTFGTLALYCHTTIPISTSDVQPTYIIDCSFSLLVYFTICISFKCLKLKFQR